MYIDLNITLDFKTVPVLNNTYTNKNIFYKFFNVFNNYKLVKSFHESQRQKCFNQNYLFCTESSSAEEICKQFALHALTLKPNCVSQTLPEKAFCRRVSGPLQHTVSTQAAPQV